MIDFSSPIEVVEQLQDARILMKRDDLIPFSYGGNKVRIASALMEDLVSGGYDYVVSFGSSSSNLNRAVADMARAAGIGVSVIIKREEESAPATNEILERAAGARIVYTLPDHVRESVEEEMEWVRASGHRPYYVYGDATGHGREDVLKAPLRAEYREIMEQTPELSHIFIAVGTGTSIRGLCDGAESYAGPHPMIHGISIARKKDVLRDLIRPGLSKIYDDYLFGGYGCFGEEIAQEIGRMYQGFGICLDPTYTAKAWYGMKEEIKRQDLAGNILFIHTGGYPCFLDALPRLDIEPAIQ